MVRKVLTMWRLWAKALGQKEGITDSEADVVAAVIPAHSRTARTGPPAITPVPGDAGRSKITPAAVSP